MAEARMGRDGGLDERVAIRQGIKPGTQVPIDVIRERVSVELLEVSLDGCAFACAPTFNPSAAEVQIHFEGVLREGPVTRPRFGQIRNREILADGRLRCGVQFEPALSQAVYSRFDQISTGALRDTRSRAKHFENQKGLALQDLAVVKAAGQNIQSMQLRLLLAGVPILLGLLGPGFTFLLGNGQSGPRAEPPWWMLLLPVGSLIFAFAILAIYLRQAANQAKHGAFAVILQRSLAESCFPPGYRGWDDASGHLHTIERRGLSPDSPFRVPADAEPPSLAPSDTPDTDTLKAATALCIAIAMLAILVMWLLAARLGLGLSRYTILVASSTLLLAYLCARALAYARRTVAGDRSFNLYYQRFNAIFAVAGYYDPERSGRY